MNATEIIPSEEQKAIFDFFENGEGHLVVEAYAGTGKTTTIKYAFEYAPENRMLYAVFNKRNQLEAQAKIKDPRVDIRTLHSLGFSYIKTHWGGAKPDDQVEWDRIASVVGRDNENKEIVPKVYKLVGLAKNSMVNPSEDGLQQILDEPMFFFDIESPEDEAQIIDATLAVIELSKQKDKLNRISFNDMVWLPAAMGWITKRYDLVVIDEAQDMNLLQLLIAIGASRGRVIIVGDRRQAIYGFRGAATGGMTMMKHQLKAAELKLTTAYRCPASVVRVAQSVVPEYKAAPSAPEGSVVGIGGEKAMTIIKPGDALLSRLNAPLMRLALQLIRAGTPARIEGKNIGKQLATMIKSISKHKLPKAAATLTEVAQFIARVEDWRMNQIERLSGAKRPEARIEQTNDIADTIIAVAESCSTVADISLKAESLFADTEDGSKPSVVLSSVHKAKGLEWKRVFLLENTFRKGKNLEEDNIYYVAVTRSMSELYLVGGFAPERKQDEAEVSPAPPATVHSEEPAATVMVAKAPPVDPYERYPKDTYNLPGGSTYHRPGNVLLHGGVEYAAERVSDSSAVFVRYGTTTVKRTTKDGKEIEFEARSDKRIRLSASHDRGVVIRRMTREEFNDFFTGQAGDQKKITKPTGTESEKQTMAKKASKGIGGSAKFARELYDSKVNKTQFREKMIAKYPAFEHDDAGIESRWRTAERISKSQAAAAKAKPAKKVKAEKKAPMKAAAKKSSPAKPKAKASAKATAAAPSSPPPPPPAPAASTPPPPPPQAVS